jgi:hypothetical protein
MKAMKEVGDALFWGGGRGNGFKVCCSSGMFPGCVRPSLKKYRDSVG